MINYQSGAWRERERVPRRRTANGPRGDQAAAVDRRLLLGFEAGSHVLHASVQTPWMLGRGDEAVSLVEARRLIVDGVDDGKATCGGLTSGDRLSQRLSEQQGTDPLALVATVDCEASQQDHSHWVGGHPSFKLGRRVRAMNRSHGEAEVADDPIVARQDERPSRVHLLRGKRMTLEPAVELLIAAVEIPDVVVGVESLDVQSGRWTHASRSFGFFLNSSTNSGTGLAGLSSSAMKRSKASLERTRS